MLPPLYRTRDGGELSANELRWGAHPQLPMRAHLVVIVEPSCQLAQYTVSIPPAVFASDQHSFRGNFPFKPTIQLDGPHEMNDSLEYDFYAESSQVVASTRESFRFLNSSMAVLIPVRMTD